MEKLKRAENYDNVFLSPISDESRPLIGQLARVHDLLSPTSDELRHSIIQMDMP